MFKDVILRDYISLLHFRMDVIIYIFSVLLYAKKNGMQLFSLGESLAVCARGNSQDVDFEQSLALRWSRGYKAQGQGEEQRTQAQVFSKQKVFKKNFRRSPNKKNKKGVRKFSARFLAFSYIILKINKSLLL